jgi:hypothetical protein
MECSGRGAGKSETANIIHLAGSLRPPCTIASATPWVRRKVQEAYQWPYSGNVPAGLYGLLAA